MPRQQGKIGCICGGQRWGAGRDSRRGKNPERMPAQLPGNDSLLLAGGPLSWSGKVNLLSGAHARQETLIRPNCIGGNPAKFTLPEAPPRRQHPRPTDRSRKAPAKEPHRPAGSTRPRNRDDRVTPHSRQTLGFGFLFFFVQVCECLKSAMLQSTMSIHVAPLRRKVNQTPKVHHSRCANTRVAIQ